MSKGSMFRWLAGVCAVAAGLVIGVGGAAAGTSVSAASGSLTVVSGAGDPVGLGGTYGFSTPSSTFLMWGDGNQVQVVIRGPNFPTSPTDSWIADFAAPAGQQLAVGTYSGTLYPFQASGDAGLRIEGLNGCNSATGSFTVSSISWGPFNYLQSIDVSFSQYCGSSTSPLTGELDLVAPPAPPPLQVTFTVDPNNSILRPDGSATVQGTVVCTQPSGFSINGQLTQLLNNKRTASGFFEIAPYQCGPTPTPWQTTIFSSTGNGFANATASLHVATATLDSFYTLYTGNNIPVLASLDATVMLAPGTRTGQG